MFNEKPDCCPICGCYLTIAGQFAGQSCLDPSHWQAAGILNSHDYYPMAQIMARSETDPDPQAQPSTSQ